MKSRLSIATSVAAVLTTAAVVFAADGVWTTTETFAQANVACFRVYTCGPASDILRDANTHVVSTAPKTVWGVCSAGGGAVDSCNVCLTSPPAEKCEWHLEPN